MIVREALVEARAQIGANGDGEAARKADLLMMYILQTDRAGLVARGNETLRFATEDKLNALVKEALHMPVYRVIGHRNFHGLDMKLHPDTLEPRDDTETLIDIVDTNISD